MGRGGTGAGRPCAFAGKTGELQAEKSVELWCQVDPNVSDSTEDEMVIGADGACGALSTIPALGAATIPGP